MLITLTRAIMGVPGDAGEHDNDSKGKEGERNGRDKDGQRKRHKTMKTMRKRVRSENVLRAPNTNTTTVRRSWVEGVNTHFRARATTLENGNQSFSSRISPPHIVFPPFETMFSMADDASPKIPQVRGMMRNACPE